MINSTNLVRKPNLVPDQEEIRNRVKNFFNTPAKLGLKNGVTSKHLFMDILELDPENLTRIEQKYYWGLIKSGIRMVRPEILITCKGGRHFVAETLQEVEDYKEFNRRNIRNCEMANERATTWFKEKKFLRLGRL